MPVLSFRLLSRLNFYDMRKFLKCLLFLLIIAGLGCAWLYHEYQKFLHTPLHLGAEERILEIPNGSSASAIADLLEKNGIIEHRWMMRYVFVKSGHEKQLQPGTVVLTPDMTPEVLPDVIGRIGKYARKTVNVLPGMNIYEIAQRLQKLRIADQKTFIRLATDPARAAEAGIPASSFEGYLAGGAYTFEAGVTPEQILDEMHSRWRNTWRKIVDEHRGAYDAALKRKYTDHTLITLASMVEKEAVVDRERPVIARVFFNRLRKKMKLQSDPTCVYPPKVVGEKPTPERCHDASNLYSTYVVPALPPGPITTPSAASMRAVLAPYNGPDDTLILYFVARQDGSWTHYFSKTYAEHQTAVSYFLKGNKSKSPKGTMQPNGK